MMKVFSNYLHLVTVSPWPLLGSLGIFLVMLGFVKWMFMSSWILMLFSLFLSFLIFLQWSRDVVRESTFQGLYGSYLILILWFSFMLFIISELFFFISFFWSFFHMMLSPPVEGGCIWPPYGIVPFNPFGIPLMNSFILITSGMMITYCHHSLLLNNKLASSDSLLLTILMGLIFSLFQGIEYKYSTFTMSDSVYDSLFFMMTGFHGIHVLVGTMFLIYCYYRLDNFHFTVYHHVGFEMASWYWHFVDVVWLFLYLIVYWWCS